MANSNLDWLERKHWSHSVLEWWLYSSNMPQMPKVLGCFHLLAKYLGSRFIFYSVTFQFLLTQMKTKSSRTELSLLWSGLQGTWDLILLLRLAGNQCLVLRVFYCCVKNKDPYLRGARNMDVSFKDVPGHTSVPLLCLAFLPSMRVVKTHWAWFHAQWTILMFFCSWPTVSSIPWSISTFPLLPN